MIGAMPKPNEIDDVHARVRALRADSVVVALVALLRERAKAGVETPISHDDLVHVGIALDSASESVTSFAGPQMGRERHDLPGSDARSIERMRWIPKTVIRE